MKQWKDRNEIKIIKYDKVKTYSDYLKSEIMQL